jgi:subtilisin family serine protease
MIRTLVAALACAALVPTLTSSVAQAQHRIPGEIVVVLRPESANALAPDAGGRAFATDRRLADALERHGLARAEAVTPVRARQGRALLLTSDRPGFDADAAVRDLLASGAVRAAAPNQTLKLDLVPNDPYLPTKEWHLSTSAAGIRAQNAWDLSTGDSSVVIAIMDTGVDRTHPDLASKIWRNAGEIAGNSIDDDGNGYVDDVNGWDFSTNDNNPNPVRAVPPDVGFDTGFHGTMLAGLAAAATNNALGMAGLDWRAKIMPLKISDSTAVITLAAVTAAFQYAIEEHADILNMSFAGTDPSLPTYFQPLVNDAIAADIVCVAGAGNDGNDIGHYPAACESVLAVGATTSANTRASYSCWGWYVDVMAPGDLVWSTIPTCYTFDTTTQFVFALAYGWDGLNPYMYNSGTSFAAPVVAGVCALVRAKFPTAPAALVMKHVRATADPVSYDSGPSFRVNAYQALLQTIDADPPSLAGGAGLALSPMVPNPMTARGSISLALASAGDLSVVVFDASGRRVRDLFAGELAAGPQRLAWDGTDDAGRRVAPGLYFVRAEHAGVAQAVRVTVLTP